MNRMGVGSSAFRDLFFFYQGVGKLVICLVWDQENVSSSLTTLTNTRVV